MVGSARLLYQSNEASIAFLFAEIALANTFLDLARSADSQEGHARNVLNSRNARDVVRRFLPRVEASEEQQADLEAQISRLDERLCQPDERPRWSILRTLSRD